MEKRLGPHWQDAPFIFAPHETLFGLGIKTGSNKIFPPVKFLGFLGTNSIALHSSNSVSGLALCGSGIEGNIGLHPFLISQPDSEAETLM